MTEHGNRAPVTGWKRDLVLTLDRWVYHLSKRWLALFNLGMGLYVLLPILAPILMGLGAPGIGRAIYTVYRPACHQLPERSVYLFGPKLLYSLEELRAGNLIAEQDGPVERQAFLGAPGLGYKVALCQRDIALYGSMVVAGLIFGLVRGRLRPLKWWVFVAMIVPMAIDGGTQLIGLRESTWWLRAVTGLLTGVACIWLLYPHLEEAFDDLRRQASKRVHPESESRSLA